MKKLFRSRTNILIAGICGGLGDYFNIDPVFIRVILLLAAFACGTGILVYLIAWLIIPEKITK
jgi:phage shock protein PspC (stress-responsive transcriptional regulator)